MTKINSNEEGMDMDETAGVQRLTLGDRFGKIQGARPKLQML
jgi:hypothetical protein